MQQGGFQQTQKKIQGQRLEITRMKQQLFNILAQKTREHPFQTVKNMVHEAEFWSVAAGSSHGEPTITGTQAEVRD